MHRCAQGRVSIGSVLETPVDAVLTAGAAGGNLRVAAAAGVSLSVNHVDAFVITC